MDLDRCRAERMRRDAKNSLDMVCLCVNVYKNENMLRLFDGIDELSISGSMMFGINVDPAEHHGAIHGTLDSHL